MEYIQFPLAFGRLFPRSVELESFHGVNTVNRQLEGFNEEKEGLFGVYFGSSFGGCTVLLVMV